MHDYPRLNTQFILTRYSQIRNQIVRQLTKFHHSIYALQDSAWKEAEVGFMQPTGVTILNILPIPSYN